MSRSSHQQVSLALQSIIIKCGQNLYDKYLNAKLPADCKQKIVGGFEYQFGAMNFEKPQKNRISRQFMPRAASVDIITPMKISFKARDNAEVPQVESKKFFNTQIVLIKPKSNKKQVPVTQNPTVCIKYDTKKAEIVDHVQQRVREQKIQSDKLKKTQPDTNCTQENREIRRTLLQRKIKQLVLQGVPYAYDDDGNLIMPDIKQYKKDQEILSKKKVQSKPFALKFKALQMLSQGSELSSNCKLLGRKRGYSSTKFQRKRKINQDQFTNKHQRQGSAIPFMTIQSGIKIVEKDRNIMAQRLHQPHLSRKQFVTESQKSLFKSYMPGSQSNSVLERRPATHSHSRNKSNFQSVGLSSALSLHSRPKTSRDRVNINNKQLAVQMVREQPIAAYSRFI